MNTSTKAGGFANPHLDGRREWNDRLADQTKTISAWRATALGAIGVALVASAGNVYQATQSKIVPYVVEVDRLNVTLPVAPADRAAPSDSRIVRAQLAEWVRDARSVYVDGAAQRASVLEAYALVDQNSAAFKVLNETMQEQDPFKRAQKETVTIDVQSVLPIGESPNSWRVEWKETVRGRDGTVISSVPWQAAITTTTNPPTTEAGVLKNPLGLYVTAVGWSARVQ